MTGIRVNGNTNFFIDKDAFDEFEKEWNEEDDE